MAYEEIPLTGGARAWATPSGVFLYHHPNWLGSFPLVTDTNGCLYYDGANAPFGENYAGYSQSGCTPPGTTDLWFTGMGQLAATGLHDFPFREYEPQQGRWISPDPLGTGAVDVTNPQTWNRYAYVGNSPLNTVDPLGLHYYDCSWSGNCGGWASGNDGYFGGGGAACALDGLSTNCGLILGDGTLGANGIGLLPDGIGLVTAVNGGFALASLAADDSMSYSFSFSATDQGVLLTNAALAEMLGLPATANSLPSNLPLGTPQKYWAPFAQGLGAALHQLKKTKCGNFYGGQGPATMTATTYRFLDLGDSTVGAMTPPDSANSVFINSNGPYMNYSEPIGQPGFLGVYWSESMFRGFILLHELGHQLSGITGFQPDANNQALNQGQSREVIGACF